MATKYATYITDYGGEGRVVVLLHGFLTSSAYWRRLQPRLSAGGYRVITIDLLGFGNAPKPTRNRYGYREHIRHINHTLATLELGEPFILAGHSMGALLAMRFAREYTGKVASLVLLHPPIFATANQAYKILRSTGAHYRFLLDSKFRRVSWGAMRLLPVGGMAMRHTGLSREGSLKHVIEAAESLDDLRQLDTRTLLVLGSNDRKEYLENVRGIVLSDSVHLKVEPVSHHSPMLRPSLILRTIHDFV